MTEMVGCKLFDHDDCDDYYFDYSVESLKLRKKILKTQGRYLHFLIL